MGRHRSGRWWRLSASLLLPAAAGVLFSPGAAGDSTGPQVTTTVLLTQAAYFWREQTGNIGGTGVAPPTPLTDPTVPSGDVAVAGPEVNGQADKETYLEFDVSAVPPGSTITSFVVTLPVDPSGQSFTPTATAPPIIACLPQGAWSGGQGPQPMSGKPSDQCATSAPKFTSTDGGKTYRADLAAIAQNWLTGVNTGVAVADDPSNSSTAYQVVFGPPQAITQLTAQMTYVPGTSSTTSIVPGQGGGQSSEPAPSLVAPSSPGSLAAPGITSGTPVPAGVPPAAAAPQAAGSARAPAPVLGRAALATAAPPGGFWVVAVLLLVLLLACSLVLGDDPAAASPRRRRSRRAVAGAWLGPPADGGTMPGDTPPAFGVSEEEEG